MNVTIIDYGAGNVRSVRFALERLGLHPVVSNVAEEISAADHVIFPGVGEASSAMARIKEFNLDALIPELKQPVLGICLGMQLMCEYSEENETKGLGVFPGSVKLFTSEKKVPHMGWNQISPNGSKIFKGVEEGSNMYFVHSYYAPQNEYTAAVCDYIQPFSAAMEKDNFYACQFHPEKSGSVGEQILKNFISL